jgi:hypothetical protein
MDTEGSVLSEFHFHPVVEVLFYLKSCMIYRERRDGRGCINVPLLYVVAVRKIVNFVFCGNFF